MCVGVRYGYKFPRFFGNANQLCAGGESTHRLCFVAAGLPHALKQQLWDLVTLFTMLLFLWVLAEWQLLFGHRKEPHAHAGATCDSCCGAEADGVEGAVDSAHHEEDAHEAHHDTSFTDVQVCPARSTSWSRSFAYPCSDHVPNPDPDPNPGFDPRSRSARAPCWLS